MMRLGFGILLLCFAFSVFSTSHLATAQLTDVFIIAHSHCDPGWLQTLDSYFYENVSLILDQVTHTLVEDQTKKFCWSEIVFFSMWWYEQSPAWQEEVRGLIESGRLEFVGAGWVQNDEADTYYASVIDQMTLGHQFLLEVFGITPLVGWQIDPFGASTLTPILWNLTGLKYHVINRVDERIKRPYSGIPNVPGSGELIRNKQFEFYWRASKNYGQSADIFTHVLDNHYNPPQLCWPNATNPSQSICTGFDFESEPENNPPINSSNLHERSDIFANILRNRSAYYVHNNLLIMFGNDFRFQNASLEFHNMDQIIAYINQNSQKYGMTLKYATPIEYFNAVAKTTQKNQFPLILNRDYFTYTMCNAYEYVTYNTCAFYWSGFYTSYPVLKEYSRSRDALLRAGDNLYATGKALKESPWYSHVDWQAAYDQIEALRQASAVLTHHDAITGTSRSYVLADYFDRLEAGTYATNEAIESVVGLLAANKGIPLLSVSGYIHFDPGMVMPIILYNSLAWERAEIVKLVVAVSSVQVFDTEGNEVDSQVVEDVACARESTKCGFYLFFLVTLPPLGYFLEYLQDEAPNLVTTTRLGKEATISLANSYYEFTFELNSTDHLYHLSAAQNLRDNLQFNLKHEILQYVGILDDPYKFRPNGTAKEYVPPTPQVYYSPGPVVSQLAVVYGMNLTVIYRLYANSSFLEVEHWASLAPNSEMISRFTTPNINANKTFFTDNGLEMQQRLYQEKFNDSFSWSMTAGNYYPVISTASITDGTRQLVVLTNQTVGGSSQSSNSLEIMIHRRTSGKHWSLNETQNDTSTAHTTFRLLLGSKSSTERDRVPISYTHQFAPLPIFSAPDFPASSTQDFIANWTENFRSSFSPLSSQLPPNLHLVGLKSLGGASLYTVMRFLHLYEQGQSPIYSQPTTLDLGRFFAAPITIHDFYESTLTANSPLPSSGGWTYPLNPLELKTFVANLE